MKIIEGYSAKLYLAQVLNGKKPENVRGIYFEDNWTVFKGDPIEFYNFKTEDEAIKQLMK